MRTRLARRYIRGSGIEIGALHRPLRVRRGVQVTYVDRLGLERLREHYPELAGHEFRVDRLDDGERLETFQADSQDFVIGSHFLEHARDPIGTLENLTRVLRPGGVLFLVVPDKRFTFDRNRPLTRFDHLVRDHEEGPEWSDEEHHLEMARLVAGLAREDEIRAKLADYRRRRYSIHFHVWDEESFRDFVDRAMKRYALPIDVERLEPGLGEIVLVARKAQPGSGRTAASSSA